MSPARLTFSATRAQELSTKCVNWVKHFCLPLHVAMKVGLYLHPSFDGAWRLVSEGSPMFIEVFPADCLHQ